MITALMNLLPVAVLADVVSDNDLFTTIIRPILVAQATIGSIGLIGLVAILRRFLNTEFPATMKGVNDRLDNLHDDFKSLETELRRNLLDVERLKEKVDNIGRRQDVLDDTAMRHRNTSTSH